MPETSRKTKWGNGEITCPRCKSYRITERAVQGRFHCNKCNKDFSVLTNIIFEGSKLPLDKWLLIVNLMLNGKSGVSAKEIQRQIGCTYKTT